MKTLSDGRTFKICNLDANHLEVVMKIQEKAYGDDYQEEPDTFRGMLQRYPHGSFLFMVDDEPVVSFKNYF